jgi:L-ascorbate metabolism protein UlaG (beta-lactamase superfamily)
LSLNRDKSPCQYRRRSIQTLLGLVATACLGRGLHAAGPFASLRFLHIRHRTYLIELGPHRILTNPWFSRGPGVPIFARAPAPAMMPQDVGQLDLILVTSGDSVHFDPHGIRKLPERQSYCFVPDEGVATKLRSCGYRRVRVVTAGDSWTVNGIQVTVSKGEPDIGGNPSVGYRIGFGNRSIWQTGALRPLAKNHSALSFARSHPTEVLLANSIPIGSPQFGLPLIPPAMTDEDAAFLGRVARSRVVVCSKNKYSPPQWMDWIYNRYFGTATTDRSPATPRFLSPQLGRWYRVLRAGTLLQEEI